MQKKKTYQSTSISKVRMHGFQIIINNKLRINTPIKNFKNLDVEN